MNYQLDNVLRSLLWITLLCGIFFTQSCQKAVRSDATAIRPVPAQRFPLVPIRGRISGTTGFVNAREGHFTLYLCTEDGTKFPPLVVDDKVLLRHRDGSPFHAEMYMTPALWDMLTGQSVEIHFRQEGAGVRIAQIVLINK